MPKSHLPPRGGPQVSQWTPTRQASPPGQSSQTSPLPVTLSLAEENRRLREELARSRQKKPFSLEPDGKSQRMVWLACALCGAAVLFALMALISR